MSGITLPNAPFWKMWSKFCLNIPNAPFWNEPKIGILSHCAQSTCRLVHNILYRIVFFNIHLYDPTDPYHANLCIKSLLENREVWQSSIEEVYYVFCIVNWIILLVSRMEMKCGMYRCPQKLVDDHRSYALCSKQLMLTPSWGCVRHDPAHSITQLFLTSQLEELLVEHADFIS